MYASYDKKKILQQRKVFGGTLRDLESRRWNDGENGGIFLFFFPSL